MEMDALELTPEEQAAEAAYWEAEQRRWDYAAWLEVQALLQAEEEGPWDEEHE